MSATSNNCNHYENISNKNEKNVHNIQTLRNLVNIQSGIFIVDHPCKITHKAAKTGALLRKLRPHASPKYVFNSSFMKQGRKCNLNPGSKSN